MTKPTLKRMALLYYNTFEFEFEFELGFGFGSCSITSCIHIIEDTGRSQRKESIGVTSVHWSDGKLVKLSSCFIVMSSGTTGTPKGICQVHRSAVASYHDRFTRYPYHVDKNTGNVSDRVGAGVLILAALNAHHVMRVKQEQEKMVCVSHAPKVNIEVVT